MGKVHYLPSSEYAFIHWPTREVIGTSELDSRLQEQIAEYGSIKDFHISLWRDQRDATGCNWNARVDRIKGDWTNDSAWWNVVPQLRNRFNLS